jgi:hypothetical protein
MNNNNPTQKLEETTMDYLQNNDKLLHVKYEKRRQRYFAGNTSDGKVILRGSIKPLPYTHAVTWELKNRDPNGEDFYSYKQGQGQIVYGSFHTRKELAERQFKYLTNRYTNKSETYDYVGEIVELKEVSAKEVRNLKKISTEIRLSKEKG